MSVDPVDFTDPRWFPVDLDIVGRRVAMLKIDEQVVERSVFMDTRLDADFKIARVHDLASVPALDAGESPAWLLHTSFCCSTLLARILSFPPSSMVFREPLILRRLADSSERSPLDRELVGTLVSMLGRPWSRNGRVLVKPTHAALNISADLLDASPGSNVLILTSSLDDFMVSNLKKTAETQSRIPLLVERALGAGKWFQTLPSEAFAPPSIIAAAGLQWAAQRQLLLDIVQRVGSGRIRVLDAEALLGDVPSVVIECATWLRLPISHAELVEKAVAMAGKHAKVDSRPYGRSERTAENKLIAAQHQDQLAQSRRWMEEFILPAMDADAVHLEQGPLSLLG